MRSVKIIALALAGLGIADGDALAFGKLLRKKAEATPSDQSYGHPPATYVAPRATPYGYVMTVQYPGYNAPHGYNQILYPWFNPIPPGSIYPGPIPPPDESKLSGGSDEK